MSKATNTRVYLSYYYIAIIIHVSEREPMSFLFLKNYVYNTKIQKH